jgi:hypothetical protein
MMSVQIIRSLKPDMAGSSATSPQRPPTEEERTPSTALYSLSRLRPCFHLLLTHTTNNFSALQLQPPSLFIHKLCTAACSQIPKADCHTHLSSFTFSARPDSHYNHNHAFSPAHCRHGGSQARVPLIAAIRNGQQRRTQQKHKI